jgi:hypothetical protein
MLLKVVDLLRKRKMVSASLLAYDKSLSCSHTYRSTIGETSNSILVAFRTIPHPSSVIYPTASHYNTLIYPHTLLLRILLAFPLSYG